MQLWHGTLDEVILYLVLNGEIKQWTNVFGVDFKFSTSDTPKPGYTKSIYGDRM